MDLQRRRIKLFLAASCGGRTFLACLLIRPHKPWCGDRVARQQRVAALLGSTCCKLRTAAHPQRLLLCIRCIGCSVQTYALLDKYGATLLRGGPRG